MSEIFNNGSFSYPLQVEKKFDQRSVYIPFENFETRAVLGSTEVQPSFIRPNISLLEVPWSYCKELLI